MRLDKSAIMLILASVMWTYHGAVEHPTKSQEGGDRTATEKKAGPKKTLVITLYMFGLCILCSVCILFLICLVCFLFDVFVDIFWCDVLFHVVLMFLLLPKI